MKEDCKGAMPYAGGGGSTQKAGASDIAQQCSNVPNPAVGEDEKARRTDSAETVSESGGGNKVGDAKV